MTKGIDQRQEQGHRFGGDWTSTKLRILSEYLSSYTKALKNQPFRKAYIDAFAGTGYRAAKPRGGSDPDTLLFPDLAEQEPQGFLDGSARHALQTEPRFDRYIFIERDRERYACLKGLKQEFPALADDIDVRCADANDAIRELCAKDKDWRSRRAVMFLDPYGMQVEWPTIEAIARTQAIDLWLLFPLGVGVNRLLKRSGEIPDEWRHRLDLLLGTTDWFEAFYRVEAERTLQGTDEERVVKATPTEIGAYFIDRLKSVFAAVAERPRILRNSRNCPLYLLCFAVGNKAGARPAMRIAEYLLRTVP